MATMIDINGTLTLDQTSGLQDDDDAIGSDLSGLSNDFITFLGDANLTGLNANVLSATQLDFADDVEAVVSGANFVTVTQNDAEINDLFFSDANGDALDGDQVFLPDGVTPLQTVNGDNVYLWSFGDFVLATTSNNVADKGDVVAAFYLNEAGDHLSASIEYVSFIGFSHPDETDPDDTIDFTDILNVSASATLSFEFDTLKSGKFLWVAVGNDDNGLLVTGRDLNVNDLGSTPEGKVGQRVSGGDDPSDAMNISQGGADIDGDSDSSTMGINNQMFREGNVGVFTLVEGFGLLGDGPDATGDDVEEIDYDGYTNVGGAGFFISQVQGSGTEINLTVRVVEAGDGTNPEEGFGYIGEEGGNDNTSGAFEDDTEVDVKTVTILDATGAEVATWSIAPGAGEVDSGDTVDGVTVTIDGHELTVMGVNNNYTVKWTVVDGETFNRFQVEALEGLDFDIGRVDIDEGIIISEPVGDSLFVDDDGPTIDIDVSGNTLDLGMDESIVAGGTTSDEGGSILAGADDIVGVTEPDGTNPFGRVETASGDIAGLFTDVTVDPGTDGDDRTDSYHLSLTDASGALVAAATTFAAGEGVETTMSVSADPDPGGDATIYLFLIDDETIEGRVDLDGDGFYTDVALRFSLDPDAAGDPPDPILTTEQILAVNHGDDTDHDDAETLGIAGADPDPDAGLGIVKTSTLEDGDIPDGDTDEDSATYNFTGDVVIEDDGPIIDITLSGEGIDIELDESIFAGGTTSDEGGTIPAADDDIVGVTEPDGTNPFGRVTTASGDIAGLFTDVTVDPGTDGDDRTDSYHLSLTDASGALVAAATTFAAGEGVETTMSVSADPAVGGDATIYLFLIDDETIEGRADLDGDGTYDDVALGFSLDNTDPDDPILTTEQILAVNHDDDTDHDDAATLGIAGEDPDPDAGLGIVKTSTLEDGDDPTGDTDEDSETYNFTGDVVIEDDGPIIDITLSGEGLDIELDESIIDPQSTSDEGGTIAAGDDDTALTAPDGTNPFGRVTTASGDIAALFSDVTVDPGTDGDDRTDSYKLSLTDADGNVITDPPDFDSGSAGFNGVETTMSVSTEVAAGGVGVIYLFQISDTVIEGRVALDADGIFDDVALRFTLDPDAAGDPPDPILTTEQILAIDHGVASNHDDSETLGIADQGSGVDAAAGLGIVKTSTLEDGDDPTGDTDTDSETYNFTGDVDIEDDGPIVSIVADATNEEFAALFRNLDETVDPDGDDTPDNADVYNPAVAETESGAGPSNGDLDDVIVDGAANETPVYETAPTGFEGGYAAPGASEAIGELRTTAGALADLFDATGVDFGTDGPGDLNNGSGRTDSLSLVLDNPVKTTLTATAVGGSPIENATAEEREIWLVWRSDTVVEGVTKGGDGNVGDDDADEYVIFRITLTNPDTPTLSTLVYEQFAPIQHADENLFDEEAPLLIDPEFSDFLKVRWTAEAEDADDDTDDDFAEVTLIDNGNTVLSFDDDGLNVGDLALGVIEEDDLRPAAGSNSDGNDEDGSVGDNPRGNNPAGNHILETNIAAIAVDVGIEEPPIFALLTDTSGLPALTSKGETVEYEVVVSDDNGTLTPNDDEYTLHAFVDVGDDNDTFDDGTDREVFRWVVTAAGVATFIDMDQIDHAIATMSSFPAVEEEEEVNLTSILAIREADGDLINLSFLDPEFAAYQIQDDVPIIAKTLAGVADDIEGGTVEFLPGESFSRSLKGSVGTDENGDDHLSGDGVTATYTFTDANVNSAPSIPGLTAEIVDGLDDLANARVVYFTDDDEIGGFSAGDTLWFDVTLNQAGAGQYTFTVHEEAPAEFLLFDFNDLPAGQNLFGTVGDEEKAIVVFGSNPDLNADGTMTSVSQTVNSSKGSQFADTVIGNSDNHFNHPGEDLWVLFVNDPEPDFLAGFDDGVTAGLDQNEADDADNVQYGSLAESDNAFYQVSRVTTSGPNKISAQTIHAFNVLDDSTQGTDIVNLLDTSLIDEDPTKKGDEDPKDNFPPDDTLVQQVSIDEVKIYAPIDLRPEGTTLADDGVVLLESTRTDGDVTDGFLSIDFHADGSVSVTGIEAGMVVEYFTDGPFDVTDIDYGDENGENGGAYDIGFIGRAEGQDTEPTDVDFTVKITDFDGDMDTSNTVDVTVDGTGAFDGGDFEDGIAV